MNARAILIFALLCSPPLRGQSLMAGFDPGGTHRQLPADSTALDSREAMKSSSSTVAPVRPGGFEVAFHAGHEMHDWSGREFDISRLLDLVSAWWNIMPQLVSANPWQRTPGS